MSDRSPGLLRRIKDQLPGWLEPLLAVPTIDPSMAQRRPVKRILIIRQHDQLGDFLLATPALRAVRERHPEAHIGLVVRSYFAEVARLVPFVDEVIVVEENASRWTLASWRRFWRSIRSSWDLAVVLTTVSHSLTSDLVARLSRAGVIVGSSGRVFAGTSRNFFYHVEAPLVDGTRHQSERNLDIVRAIGCDSKDVREEIRVPDVDRRSVQVASERFPGRRVGFHLGAGKLANRWPVERFVELAAALRRTAPTTIVLFWGPAEASLRDEFLRQEGAAAECVGPQPLPTLAAWFRSCDLMVCNDTGVVHVAAATGVPTLALFGPTDPREWAPAGDHVRALRGTGGEVSTIRAEEAARLAEELLAR